jgi:hypothetical protein
VFSQVAYVGAAVTSPRWAEQNAWTAPARMGPEPVATITEDSGTPWASAIVATRSSV